MRYFTALSYRTEESLRSKLIVSDVFVARAVHWGEFEFCTAAIFVDFVHPKEDKIR